jgi:hypothetical protein
VDRPDRLSGLSDQGNLFSTSRPVAFCLLTPAYYGGTRLVQSARANRTALPPTSRSASKAASGLAASLGRALAAVGFSFQQIEPPLTAVLIVGSACDHRREAHAGTSAAKIGRHAGIGAIRHGWYRPPALAEQNPVGGGDGLSLVERRLTFQQKKPRWGKRGLSWLQKHGGCLLRG